MKAAIVKTSPMKIINVFTAAFKTPADDLCGDCGGLAAGALGDGAGVDAGEFPADNIVLGAGCKPRRSVRDTVMSNKILTSRPFYRGKKRVRRTSRLRSHAFPWNGLQATHTLRPINDSTAEAYRFNQCGASLDATLASLLVKLGKVQTFNLERLLYTWW